MLDETITSWIAANPLALLIIAPMCMIAVLAIACVLALVLAVVGALLDLMHINLDRDR